MSAQDHPPPPTSTTLLLSLSDCKQAGGVPHMSRNNKKGDLRAFAAVCVCVFTRACGPLTLSCFLPLLFTLQIPLIPAPEQFPPSAPFFGFAVLQN